MRDKTHQILVLLTFFFIFFSISSISNFLNQPLNTNNSINLEQEDLQIQQIEEIFQNYSKISRRRVFFDMSHEQVFSIFDTGFFGYSELNILLQDYFLEVSMITSNLTNYVNNMTSEDILFLNVAKNGNYSIEEINIITNLVDRGGKLFILGEHNVLGFSEFQNQLLQHFDMQISTQDLQDNVNNVEDQTPWIVFNSSYFNLKNLSIMFGAALNLTGNAFAIANSSYTANYPNVPVMAGYNNSNGGKVFCATDSEWLWNGNGSLGGIKYGNNSKLILKVLDWFYDTNLSIECESGTKIIPEFNLFTSQANTNFSLNITLTNQFNVSAEISGGSIFPKFSQNLIGKNSWEINISKDGYVKFTFLKPLLNINISKIVYFFEGNSSQKALFIQNNYSRQLNPTPSGLLNFAYELRNRNYSVYGSNLLLNFSKYNCIFIANPQQVYNSELVDSINQAYDNKTKLVFLNSPHSSLYIKDFMTDFFRVVPGINIYKVPINNISAQFGVNFSHHILNNDRYNIDGKIYYPRVIGKNSTVYNISSYMASIINVSSNFNKELLGYNYSWGEDHSIFGLSQTMGFDSDDINNTCILAHNNNILASGMLNYFTNEHFKPSKYFNDFIFNWLETGKFNRKYRLSSNVTHFYFNNTHFKVSVIEKIRNLQGSIVPDGTIFNVKITRGEILSSDASLTINGHQVVIFNGELNLTCSSKEESGLCEIAIYNSTDFKIILSSILNFSHEGEDINPKLAIDLPVNNSYCSIAPIINVNAIDKNLHLIWYNVTGNPTKEFLENNTAEYLNDSLWDSLPQGKFNISFYANDTWGNLNDTFTLTLYKDTIAPNIKINLPYNNTYLKSAPIVNLTVFGMNLEYIWYNVSGNPNKEFLTNNSAEYLNDTLWASLGQGMFKIGFYANDSVGNINNTFTLTLYKDLYAPNITINLLQNNTYWNTLPQFSVTVYDLYLDSVWYNVIGNPKSKFLTNNSAEYLNDTLWASIGQGMFQVSFFANDSAGNTNNTFVFRLYKDIYAPNITINQPVNESHSETPPIIRVIVREISLEYIWYNVTGDSTKIFISNDTSIVLDSGIWNNLGEGMFKISFYANDTARNINNTITLILYKDITKKKNGGSTNDDDFAVDQNITLVYIIPIVAGVIAGIFVIIYVSKNRYKWKKF